MLKLKERDVEAQMRRCDLLSINGYLTETGYGKPTDYWVRSKVRPSSGPYPAKAVAGASLGLTHKEFNGGYSNARSACNLLEGAGFLIVDKGGKPLSKRMDVAKFEKRFAEKLAEIGKTEIDRLGRQRIGQDIFRAALLEYWDGCCTATGISDRSLLRASHIMPWSKCIGTHEKERLNPENGLLLSSLWDAAFEVGLVSFSDDGDVLVSSKLSREGRDALSIESSRPITMTLGHKRNMVWHRKYKFTA